MSEDKEKDLLLQLLKERAAFSDMIGVDDDDDEIDFAGFFHILRKRILIIILAAVVGAALLGVYSFFIAKPMYQSTAKVYVLSQSTSLTSFADIQISSALALDYQEMITSYPVVKQVKNNLGLDYKYKEIIEGMLEIENPADTRVIKIKITSEDPEESATIVNEFAKVSKQTIADIMETDEPKVFEHGRVITEPVSPNKKLNIAIGFVGGAFLTVLVLFILFITRDTIRTPEDIERRLGGQVLATVPLEKSNKSKGNNKVKDQSKKKGSK